MGRRTPYIGSFVERLTRRAPGGSRLGGAAPARTRVRDRVRDAVDRARGASRRGVGVVTIDYSPAMDGDPDPGEVVWAWVPYEEDPTQGKDRPVVVIGRRGEALVGIPLTSKPNDREAQVDVGTGAWDGERRTSYARVERMVDVDPERMRREGAVLERERFDRLVDAVDAHHAIRRVANGRGSHGGRSTGRR